MDSTLGPKNFIISQIFQIIYIWPSRKLAFHGKSLCKLETCNVTFWSPLHYESFFYICHVTQWLFLYLSGCDMILFMMIKWIILIRIRLIFIVFSLTRDGIFSVSKNAYLGHCQGLIGTQMHVIIIWSKERFWVKWMDIRMVGKICTSFYIFTYKRYLILLIYSVKCRVTWIGHSWAPHFGDNGHYEKTYSRASLEWHIFVLVIKTLKFNQKCQLRV